MNMALEVKSFDVSVMKMALSLEVKAGDETDRALMSLCEVADACEP